MLKFGGHTANNVGYVAPSGNNLYAVWSLCIGLLKWFLDDGNGCWNQKLVWEQLSIMEDTPDHLPDIGIFQIQDIGIFQIQDIDCFIKS